MCTDREYLRTSAVKTQNHLRSPAPYLEHRVPSRSKIRSQKALRYWVKAHAGASPFLMRTMKRKVKRLQTLRVEIKELDEELASLLAQSGSTLPTASGCGTVVAATLIAEIGDINRFQSPAALAKYAGCAPREYGSGKKQRYRKTRAGNRRLNCAFHRMALAQISMTGNDRARTYFKKKVAEGKSKSQALVCLRRQLVNVIWCMMKYKTEYRYPQ